MRTGAYNPPWETHGTNVRAKTGSPAKKDVKQVGRTGKTPFNVSVAAYNRMNGGHKGASSPGAMTRTGKEGRSF